MSPGPGPLSPATDTEHEGEDNIDIFVCGTLYQQWDSF